jgi:hypothetical protein
VVYHEVGGFEPGKQPGEETPTSRKDKK